MSPIRLPLSRNAPFLPGRPCREPGDRSGGRVAVARASACL